MRTYFLVRMIFVCILVAFAGARADEFDADTHAPLNPNKKTVGQLIEKVKSTVKTRGYRWDLSVFSFNGWQTQGHSVDGYPLLYYACGDPKNTNSSLILSTVHGDEVAPIYFGFRVVEWLKARPEICEKKRIVVAPLVNPDGFFRYTKGTRTNFRKVDLNRNFDTPDWEEKALLYWRTKFKKERRYFPGLKAASEPETMFQKWLIDEFSPTKIMTVHAPLNILDYDGPSNHEVEQFAKNYVDSCESLKAAIKGATPTLKFYAYGIFPGSLGNYAGKQRGIPTFTVEFPTVNASEAPFYFGDLEIGTRLFFDYEINGTRAKITSRN